MSKIVFDCTGDFSETFGFLEKCKEVFGTGLLDKYGKMGVELLSKATPIDTGETARSWYYEIEHLKSGSILHFCNDDIEKGANVAILIQYGHATKNGTFVEGRDYINPTMDELFKIVCDDLSRGVL